MIRNDDDIKLHTYQDDLTTDDDKTDDENADRREEIEDIDGDKAERS